ncbi:hypothetical protein GEMRC1_004953 [Eukaryota sp. GEM-RC1]
MYQNFNAEQCQEFRTQSRLNGETYPSYEKDSFLLKPTKQLKGSIKETAIIENSQGKLLGFIINKHRVNSLVTIPQAYNLLKTPFSKEHAEEIEREIDDLNSYVDVEVPSYTIPAIKTNHSDTASPLVEDAPYSPGGTCLKENIPHAMHREPSHLPFSPRHQLSQFPPEAQAHTPAQSDSPPPIQTPFAVLKFTERLPSDMNSDLNKSITPPLLKTLDDPDGMINWIGDYMSFCLVQPDYKQPADKPLGQAIFFFDIGRIAASDADTRWVPRLVDF